MKRKAFAQIPLMIGLLLMAVAIPVATRLVQTNQENRGKAAASCAGEGQKMTTGYLGCCAGLNPYDCTTTAGYTTCTCRKPPTNPTATPAYKNCTVRTCGNGVCNSLIQSVKSNLACPPSNCTSNNNCAVPTAVPTTAPKATLTPTTCLCVNGKWSGSVASCGHSLGLDCTMTCDNATCNANCIVQGKVSGTCGSANNCMCSTVPTPTPTPKATTSSSGGSTTTSGGSTTTCDSLESKTSSNYDSVSGVWLHFNEENTAKCICGGVAGAGYHYVCASKYWACGSGPKSASACAACVQACPNSSQKNLLQNCTPPDSDGTSKDTLCNAAGTAASCGGKSYCCPSAGGAWTTDMTKCPTICKITIGKQYNLNDFSIWRSEYVVGSYGTVSKSTWQSDFDCDGKVTLNDYSIWRQNYINAINGVRL